MTGVWEVRVTAQNGGVVAVAMLPVDPLQVFVKTIYHPPPTLPSGPPSDPKPGQFWDNTEMPGWRRVNLDEGNDYGLTATHVWDGTRWLPLISPDAPED